jgi:hypothetical protein
MIGNHVRKAIAIAAVFGVTSVAQAVSLTVDPAAPWQGYMNVFELPENGGGYVFGSPWGTADLTANFTGNVLTLGPNSVNDPNPFWYTPAGGPGSAGNKIMDAAFYVESNELVGQTVEFKGAFLTNTFTAAHIAYAFIRDFAPDYSSFNEVQAPATPGNFNLSMATDPGAGRHIQYGFLTRGVNVWSTDVGPYGTVTVTGTTPGLVGDFDNDGDRDATDIDMLFDATPGTVPPADAIYDVNADGSVNLTIGAAGSDVDHWVRNLKTTEYGDANLNGGVNFDDLLTLAQNYGVVGNPSWAVGNFNGDTTIGFDDLLALAQHYNFGTLMDTTQLDAAGSQFAIDFALARSLVPEPVSVAGLGGFALLATRRRRA